MMRPPANPAASREARGLLAFLHAISGRFTIAGQHDFLGSGAAFQRQVAAVSGRSPLLWGSDLSFACTGEDANRYQHCGPGNLSIPGEPFRVLDIDLDPLRRQLVDEAIAQHRSGRVVTLMWHHLFPSESDAGPGRNLWMMQRRPERSTWRELTTPGTRMHRLWREQIERCVVPHLARLREARVPVLWRPYHEMNGIWFWWCGQAGPGGIAALWRQMYELLTLRHGLDNLLWVWNANAPRAIPGDEAFDYASYYPGGDVVDVLASDVYHDDWRQSHHDLLLELADGRPLAIGECGQAPTPAILAEQARWTWFMPWGNLGLKLNPPEKLRALYADPRVLCHGDVGRDGLGAWWLAKTIPSA